MFLFQDNQTSCTLYFTIHQKMSIIGAKIINLPQYGTKKQKIFYFYRLFIKNHQESEQGKHLGIGYGGQFTSPRGSEGYRK